VSDVFHDRSPMSPFTPQRPFYISAYNHCLAPVTTRIGPEYTTTSKGHYMLLSVVSRAPFSRRVPRWFTSYDFPVERVSHDLFHPCLERRSEADLSAPSFTHQALSVPVALARARGPSTGVVAKQCKHDADESQPFP